MKNNFSAREICLMALLYGAIVMLYLSLEYFPVPTDCLLRDSFYLNVFLINITAMGDTVFAYILVLFLFFFLNKNELPLKLLSAVFITSVLIQLIKNIYSPLSLHFYFEEGVYFNRTINEPYINIISSHAAIIFTITGLFITVLKNKAVKGIIFFLAAVVAYSRIYLAGDDLPAIFLSVIPAFTAVFLVQRAIFKINPESYHSSSNRSSVTRNLFPY